MKTGPNWFPTTATGGTQITVRQPTDQWPFLAVGTAVYTWQNVSNVTNTSSLPIDCRGAYDKSIQLVGTPSSMAIVRIDVSIDPIAVTTPSQAAWWPIGTVTSSSLLTHAGIIRAMRAVCTQVSATDSFGVMFMLDDRG